MKTKGERKKRIRKEKMWEKGSVAHVLGGTSRVSSLVGSCVDARVNNHEGTAGHRGLKSTKNDK